MSDIDIFASSSGIATHVSIATLSATFTSARNCTPNEVLSSTSIFQVAFERMTKVVTASGPTTMKIMVVAPPDGNIFTVGGKCFCYPEVSFQPSFQPAASAKHLFRAILSATLASARNCTPNVVLSSGTNMFQGAFERMMKDTTLTAPSTMKIKVVAPPDGNIFTVGAKRFHCAEVLPAEVSAVPVGLLVGETSLEESPVAVHGTAPLCQCKSVPICVVATLMSLATAGKGPLSQVDG